MQFFERDAILKVNLSLIHILGKNSINEQKFFQRSREIILFTYFLFQSMTFRLLIVVSKKKFLSKSNLSPISIMFLAKIYQVRKIQYSTYTIHLVQQNHQIICRCNNHRV